jgi:Family of unknown function (DUF5926)/SEC-C motif
MGKSSRRRAAAVVLSASPSADLADLPVVGQRKPCPCGSGLRYKACHGRFARQQVPAGDGRPFEGLPGECDWVALREIVPAATASVHLSDAYGGGTATVVTVLPMSWPALRRADGTVLLGLQTTTGSGDPSRDLAHALIAALDTEPGNPVLAGRDDGTAPRLQDVLRAEPLEVTVHDGFDFWLDGAEVTPDVQDSLERANAAVVPTRRLQGVEAAYWCRIGERRHLRWVVPFPEDAVLDGLARLHAAGAGALGEGSRYVGSFRAHGLLVPVWDLAPTTDAEGVEEPAAAFGRRLADAMADDRPLTVDERRARAGVVSRQLTLR